MTQASKRDDLRARFARVSRGRKVVVSSRESRWRSSDYQVEYEENDDTFCVTFTYQGHFEEAYRCVERYIAARAERLDGVYSPAPEGYLDFREDIGLWPLERVVRQIGTDVRSALIARIEELERDRPGEDQIGEITIEIRTDALRALVAHGDTMLDEVRVGLLSQAVWSFLRDIGVLEKSENGS